MWLQPRLGEGELKKNSEKSFRGWVWTENKSVEQLSSVLGTTCWMVALSDKVESTGVLPLICLMIDQTLST